MKRRGFILPTTLLVLTLLTVMLTAAFIMASAEFRTGDNAFAISKAHALAQAGLEEYLSQNHQVTAGYDSARITMNGGYADVIARRVRDSTGGNEGIWAISSFGNVSDPTQPGQLAGRRAVGTLAYYMPGSLPVRAALTTINNDGIAALGIAVTGLDAGCSPLDDTTGVGYVNSNGAPTSGTTGGSPANANLGNASSVYDATHIDWSSLLAGNFTSDYTVVGASGWPASYTSFPVGYVNGNVTIPNGVKQGLLVVTGDVTLSSGTDWRGILLIGGRLITPINGWQVRGGVVTGLNIPLGGSVGSNVILRLFSGQITWSSCNVKSAAASLATFSPIRGTWVDNWSTY